MADRSDNRLSRRLRRLTGWAGFGLVVLGIATGLATFATLTGLTPLKPTREITLLFLLVNVALVLVMAVIVGGQLLFLLVEKRRGTAGAGLHLRLVLLFSLVAVVPAIVVAAFATVTR